MHEAKKLIDTLKFIKMVFLKLKYLDWFNGY